MRLKCFIAQKFNSWNKLSCPKCGCKQTIEKPKEYIDYSVCESEILCKNCGYQVNYWAYGYMQEPETKTELIDRWWYHLKIKIKNSIKN